MTKTPSSQSEKRKAKSQYVRRLAPARPKRHCCARLAKPGGVSLTEMMRTTGWQAHTLRAALTGLRKTGVILTRCREGGDTIYAIDPAGPASAPGGGAGQGAQAAKANLGIEADALAAPPVAAPELPDAAITELGEGAA